MLYIQLSYLLVSRDSLNNSSEISKMSDPTDSGTVKTYDSSIKINKDKKRQRS